MEKKPKVEILKRSNVKAVDNNRTRLSLPLTESIYDRWVSNVLNEYRSTETAERYSSLDEYMVSNAYFVTITFHRRRMAGRKRERGLRQTDATLEMDAFHKLYGSLVKATLGNQWSKPKFASRWPLAIVAIDHPEAKYAFMTTGEMTNLHCHAVMVCRSQDRKAFEAALADQPAILSFQATTLADSVDFRPWDPTKDKDYILKAHVKGSLQAAAAVTDVRIYPKPTATRQIGWANLNSYPRFSASLQKLRRGLLDEAKAELEYGNRHGFEPD